MAKYDANLRDYWRIIRRRKTIIIVITLLISSSSFLFSRFKAAGPQYEATAAVKFERSTNVAGLFIEAISYTTGDLLATQSMIITSYPIMEKVAKELWLIDPKLSSDQIRQSEKLSGIIANLQDQVKAEQAGHTNVINITATASHAKMAQRLANTVARVYREQNIAEKNRQTKEARSFIEQQLKIIEGSLKNAEERLRAYKEEKTIVALDQQISNAINRIANLESEYEKVNRRIAEVSLQLSRLRKGVGPPFKTPKLFLEDVSPSMSKLNSALLDLMVRKDALLLNYTEKSPQVQELEGRIKKITAGMERALSSTLKTLKGKREILHRQLRISRERYRNIPEEHLNLIRLQREVKVNEDLFSLLKSKHQEALIREAEQVEEVAVIKPALRPARPVNSPKALAITLVGIIVGSILGLVTAITVETMDTSIGTIEDVEELLGVPVLGVIPYTGIQEVKETLADKFPEVKNEDTLRRYARLITHFAPRSNIAESYRTFKTSVLAVMGKEIKTLLITSTSPLEGKTSTIINLALSMAQAGKNTLLVESDLRKPRIASSFGIEERPGLVDMFLGNYKWTEVTKNINDIMLGKMTVEEISLTPGMDNVSIVPCGPVPPNPAEVIDSPRMKDFVNQAREKYDVVLLDSAPVLTASDAAVAGSYVDGVIMVYQVGRVARVALRRAKAQLESVKAKVIGVVLNGVKPEISTDYDTLKYGYYYYGEKRRGLRRWGAVFPTLKGLWEKMKGGSVKKKEGQREDEGMFRKGRFAILIFSLVFLIGGILWQQYGVGKMAQSPVYIKTEKPQQAFKTPTKTPIKTPTTEKKKTAPSLTKTEKAPPEETSETIRKVQLERPATEQEGISHFHYPYSIHISSHFTQKGALDDLRRLKEKGHQGYLTLVDLGRKGTWYRVFIGPFENQKAAKKYFRNLEEFPGAMVVSNPETLTASTPETPAAGAPEASVKTPPWDEFVIHPWVVEVSAYDSYYEAQHLLTKLKAQGLPAFLTQVTLRGQKWIRVRVGFYTTEKEAQMIKERIASEFGIQDCWVHLLNRKTITPN